MYTIKEENEFIFYYCFLYETLLISNIAFEEHVKDLRRSTPHIDIEVV